ncbi:DSBA-like thioredoxin domain-containing protein [Phlyctochytrium arcticum]|nr:DSBA-like thioredoxin domain-containing protein [Phlyctochytrium arcticum]
MSVVARRVIPIEVVSDTICPWCYIGKKRLDKAIATAKAKQLPVDFQIKFKPFQLDGTLPKEGVSKLERYRAKFGEARMQQMMPHITQVAAGEGIKLSMDGLTASTIDSHRVLDLAAKKGLQLPLVDELFADYFERSKNIGDPTVLADAAARVGLKREEVLEYLASNEGEEKVMSEIEEARRRRITGVPHFRIAEQYSLSGAQEPDAFLEIFEALAKQGA